MRFLMGLGAIRAMHMMGLEYEVGLRWLLPPIEGCTMDQGHSFSNGGFIRISLSVPFNYSGPSILVRILCKMT